MGRLLLLIAHRSGRLPRLMNLYLFRKLLGDRVRVEAWKCLGLVAGRRTELGPRVTIRFPENVTIGDSSKIGGDVLIDAWAGVRLGSSLIVNDEVKILTGSHYIDSPTFEGFGKPISIGDHVWLPHRIIVMPGVTIGDNAVIGSGSVVTRSVEPFAVVAGNPAKRIGERRRQNYVYDPTTF